MDKMIVVVFKNEKSAYEGVNALKELHAEGSLTLYASAVIAKDAKTVVSIKQAVDQGPLGTVLGFATGSLIGLLGGPVGLAFGAATGTLAGSVYDVAQIGISGDFLDEVSQHLTPGKVAVIAEVDEEWITPLDTRMEALGGTVIRRARAGFIDRQIERELAADKAEIATLKAEYKQAVGAAKPKIKAKLDAVEQSFQTRRSQMNEKIEAMKREGEAKTKLLQEQAKKARAAAKSQIDERITEIRADQKRRLGKLEQAWKLTQEALRP